MRKLAVLGLCAVVAMSIGFYACGSSDNSDAGAVSDGATVADSGGGSGDTGATQDTGGVSDTGTTDTGGTEDTGVVPDGGIEDTGVVPDGGGAPDWNVTVSVKVGGTSTPVNLSGLEKTTFNGNEAVQLTKVVSAVITVAADQWQNVYNFIGSDGYNILVDKAGNVIGKLPNPAELDFGYLYFNTGDLQVGWDASINFPKYMGAKMMAGGTIEAVAIPTTSINVAVADVRATVNLTALTSSVVADWKDTVDGGTATKTAVKFTDVLTAAAVVTPENYKYRVVANDGYSTRDTNPLPWVNVQNAYIEVSSKNIFFIDKQYETVSGTGSYRIKSVVLIANAEAVVVQDGGVDDTGVVDAGTADGGSGDAGADTDGGTAPDWNVVVNVKVGGTTTPINLSGLTKTTFNGNEAVQLTTVVTQVVAVADQWQNVYNFIGNDNFNILTDKAGGVLAKLPDPSELDLGYLWFDTGSLRISFDASLGFPNYMSAKKMAGGTIDVQPVPATSINVHVGSVRATVDLTTLTAVDVLDWKNALDGGSTTTHAVQFTSVLTAAAAVTPENYKYRVVGNDGYSTKDTNPLPWLNAQNAYIEISTKKIFFTDSQYEAASGTGSYRIKSTVLIKGVTP